MHSRVGAAIKNGPVVDLDSLVVNPAHVPLGMDPGQGLKPTMPHMRAAAG